MSFSSIITPRPEVLRKGGIEGVIDIQNIKQDKKNTIEKRPTDFFDLTYPTADIKNVLTHLHERFNSNERTAGLFLLEGYKGSGKSHLELLIYHLFKNPEPSKRWMEQHNLTCNVPDNAIVSIHKFTDFPLDSLWAIVLTELGMKDRISHERTPNLTEIQDALQGKHLVLILDELEMGITSIPNDNVRAQNLSFLQMLSEEALRSDNASITIFASVYDSRREPGATLKRVSRIDVKFSDPVDRQRIILHRLFKNYLQMKNQVVEPVIQSYVNNWKRHNIKVDEKYIDEFYRTYPFTPEIMDLVLYRVPASGGFQGSRGVLGLLGSVVRMMHDKADILSSSHLNIDEAGIRNRLSDLEPSQTLIQCAQKDLRDLSDLPFAPEIISSVLSMSLTNGTGAKGISEDELARQVIKPGDDINKYYGTLQALVKLGSYFQSQEGNYFFDEQEKPNSKVEYRSLNVEINRALDYAFKTWKNDVFRHSQVVVYKDIDQAHSELNLLDRTSLRFVYAPKRLANQERVKIFHGAENQNQIILLEPREESFNGLNDQDIIKWAQRAIAAHNLKNSASDSERKRQYDRIEHEDSRYIADKFKKAGLVFVWAQPAGGERGTFDVEFETLGNVSSQEDILRKMRQDIFPRQLFDDHISERLEHYIGRTVRDVDNAYRKTLGFPVRTAETVIIDPIKNLCLAGKIGLRHDVDSACGRNPNLSSNEIMNARISEPFEDSKLSGETKSTSMFGKDDKSRHDSLTQTEKDMESDIENEFSGQGILTDVSNTETLTTPYASGIGALRQTVAEKLNNYPDAVVRKIQFLILAEHRRTDLSSIPQALRGTLSGQGDIVIDLNITKEGEFTKAQVEQLVESLPSIAGAQYQADMKVKIREGESKK